MSKTTFPGQKAIWSGSFSFTEIPQDEFDRLVEVGEARYRTKFGYDSTVDLSVVPSHVIGMMGEWAFGKKFGVDVDMSVKPDGDRGHDFILDGSIDVKTSTYLPNPDLKVFPNPKNPPDVYVLAVVDYDNRQVALAGWCYAEELLESPTVDYGYGPTHAINWRGLREFDH